MTTATQPLPPTDGSHPHAQPVVYAAKRPDFKNHPDTWVQRLGDLITDVLLSPAERAEIDAGLNPEDCTAAVRREYLAMHQAGSKPKPKTLAIGKAQKPVPVAERPNKPRNRDTTPRLSTRALIGVQVIECKRCKCSMVRTGTTQKYCKPCAQDVIREKKREEKRAKMPVEITCKRCGYLTPRVKDRQNFCPACVELRAKERLEKLLELKRERMRKYRAEAREVTA